MNSNGVKNLLFQCCNDMIACCVQFAVGLDTLTQVQYTCPPHANLLSTGWPRWQRRELIGRQFKILGGASARIVVLLTSQGGGGEKGK